MPDERRWQRRRHRGHGQPRGPGGRQHRPRGHGDHARRDDHHDQRPGRLQRPRPRRHCRDSLPRGYAEQIRHREHELRRRGHQPRECRPPPGPQPAVSGRPDRTTVRTPVCAGQPGGEERGRDQQPDRGDRGEPARQRGQRQCPRGHRAGIAEPRQDLAVDRAGGPQDRHRHRGGDHQATDQATGDQRRLPGRLVRDSALSLRLCRHRPVRPRLACGQRSERTPAPRAAAQRPARPPARPSCG